MQEFYRAGTGKIIIVGALQPYTMVPEVLTYRIMHIAKREIIKTLEPGYFNRKHIVVFSYFFSRPLAISESIEIK